MIEGRLLTREEVPRLWTIDRSEVIERIFVLEDGLLVPKEHYFNARGWPPGQAEADTPDLEASFDAGGWFYGLFEGETLVGAAILDSRVIGEQGDLLQLSFLHVSQAVRGQGLGRTLFDSAASEAKRRGARGLYVSATPSENTVNFYRHRDCTVTPTPDPALFALEPDDIHFECRFD